MIDSVMLWNEPNNLSHWNFQLDPDWKIFSTMVKLASEAIRSENPRLTRVLGGISPIDVAFLRNMSDKGVLETVDVVALHGFPLDWNHWMIHEWPDKLVEVRDVVKHPLWVTEVGVSTFGAEEVQDFGLRRTAELLIGRVDRIHWYSLFDLPRTWPATTRHREAEGSSYYRHFYMGLISEGGSAKQALTRFAEYTPALGICQWFHFEDPRLDSGVEWLKRLGVKHLRTGLSWADWLRPGAARWFDHMMGALDEFSVTATFCFTPEEHGLEPHHTSPPREIAAFADFCAAMVKRYAA
jgi:beta-xylosidase